MHVNTLVAYREGIGNCIGFKDDTISNRTLMQRL